MPSQTVLDRQLVEKAYPFSFSDYSPRTGVTIHDSDGYEIARGSSHANAYENAASVARIKIATVTEEGSNARLYAVVVAALLAGVSIVVVFLWAACWLIGRSFGWLARFAERNPGGFFLILMFAALAIATVRLEMRERRKEKEDNLCNEGCDDVAL